MATVYGANYTKTVNPSGSNILAGGVYKGRVRVLYDSYEASALADGDAIAMGTVPAGATIIGATLVFDAVHAASSGGTLSVGTASDADLLVAAVSGESAGTATIAIDGLGTKVTEDTVIYVTNANAAATGTIKLVTLYVTD